MAMWFLMRALIETPIWFALFKFIGGILLSIFAYIYITLWKRLRIGIRMRV